MNWIDLDQECYSWWATVNAVLNHWVPQNAGNLLTDDTLYSQEGLSCKQLVNYKPQTKPNEDRHTHLCTWHLKQVQVTVEQDMCCSLHREDNRYVAQLQQRWQVTVIFYILQFYFSNKGLGTASRHVYATQTYYSCQVRSQYGKKWQLHHALTCCKHRRQQLVRMRAA